MPPKVRAKGWVCLDQGKKHAVRTEPLKGEHIVRDRKGRKASKSRRMLEGIKICRRGRLDKHCSSSAARTNEEGVREAGKKED